MSYFGFHFMRLTLAYSYKQVENSQKLFLPEEALKETPVKVWNWYSPNSVEA